MKNFEVASNRRLNNVEILRSYLAQNGETGVSSNLRKY